MVGYKGRGDWNSAAVVGATMIIVALFGSVILAGLSKIVMRGRLK